MSDRPTRWAATVGDCEVEVLMYDDGPAVVHLDGDEVEVELYAYADELLKLAQVFADASRHMDRRP